MLFPLFFVKSYPFKVLIFNHSLIIIKHYKEQGLFMLDANSHKSKDITSSSQSMIQSNFSLYLMNFLIDDLARSAQKPKGSNNKLGGMRSNPNA